jgi:hypothetical protein
LYRPLVACGAALALGGCVAAVPLAQMAASSLASPGNFWSNQPCAQPNGCSTGMTNMSMQDMAKQFNMSMQKWTGTAPSDQAGAPPGVPPAAAPGMSPVAAQGTYPAAGWGASPSMPQGASPAVARGFTPPVVQSVSQTTIQPGWSPSAMSLR